MDLKELFAAVPENYHRFIIYSSVVQDHLTNPILDLEIHPMVPMTDLTNEIWTNQTLIALSVRYDLIEVIHRLTDNTTALHLMELQAIIITDGIKALLRITPNPNLGSRRVFAIGLPEIYNECRKAIDHRREVVASYGLLGPLMSYMRLI